MFEGLSEKLSGILDKLTRRGALSEEDVNLALREVRRALLEADVALDVVRSCVDKVRARAVGANVVTSVTPGQMVVKIVNDGEDRQAPLRADEAQGVDGLARREASGGARAARRARPPGRGRHSADRRGPDTGADLPTRGTGGAFARL